MQARNAPVAPARTLRIGIVTLGCDKNTVDNEYLAGLLDEAGCELVTTRREGDAPLDAVVVTTCGFIGPAKEQSIEAIVQLAERKERTGDPRRLFVSGCLTQRYGEELMREIPGIDGMVGVGQFARLAEMILTADGREEAGTVELAAEPQVDIYRLMRRRPLENRPYAFLKISDGCNHGCTFCSIPLMKGKLRSVPPEIVLEEARGLLARGARELNLVAQDLSAWGVDRWPEWRLPRLLRELCRLEGDFWIRCLYVYPGQVTDELLEVMASEPKVLPYLDMPLQHLDPAVLRRMKRPFHERNTYELVERMRAAVPGLVLRSTMIVGFPGESVAEHRAMLKGIERLRFDRLGAFEYSPEEDTPAGRMQGQVAPRTRSRRWHAVMVAQAPIALEKNQARVGGVERVLIEGWHPEHAAWVGRGAGEAPEIDGKVYVHAERPLEVGQFVMARIERAEPYDLWARQAE